MPSNCAVATCKFANGKVPGQEETFPSFRFPKSPETRSIWMHRCGRADSFDPEKSRICGLHFNENDLSPTHLLKKSLMPGEKLLPILKPYAVPSLHLPMITADARTSPGTSSRAARMQQRKTRQEMQYLLMPEQDVTVAEELTQSVNAEVQPSAAVVQLRARVRALEKQLKLQSAAHQRRALKWRREKAALQRKLRCRNDRVAAAEQLVQSGLVSEWQLRRLSTGKRTDCSTREKAAAVGLRYLSKKAYKYVKEVMQFPLPSLRTLSRWTSGFEVSPGFIPASATVLDAAVRTMPPPHKLTVLSFDEVSLDARWCYDRTYDQALQAGKMQVVMARSLCGSWKQPVYFGYDQKMTPEILVDVIRRLEQLGLTVVAAVSDMHPDNEAMWKVLGISDLRSWIVHPADSSRPLDTPVSGSAWQPVPSRPASQPPSASTCRAASFRRRPSQPSTAGLTRSTAACPTPTSWSAAGTACRRRPRRRRTRRCARCAR